MRKEITEAWKLFDQNDMIQSLEILDNLIQSEPGNCPALLLRARIQYKSQKWGDAMNDYASVLEIDPENREAKSGLEMAKGILGYFTPDMFNP